jgi:hypothetical protein
MLPTLKVGNGVSKFNTTACTSGAPELDSGISKYMTAVVEKMLRKQGREYIELYAMKLLSRLVMQ